MTFSTTLRQLIKHCEFGDQKNKLLRAQIALGIDSKEIQQQLLQDNMALDSMVDYNYKSVELTTGNINMHL